MKNLRLAQKNIRQGSVHLLDTAESEIDARKYRRAMKRLKFVAQTEEEGSPLHAEALRLAARIHAAVGNTAKADRVRQRAESERHAVNRASRRLPAILAATMAMAFCVIVSFWIVAHFQSSMQLHAKTKPVFAPADGSVTALPLADSSATAPDDTQTSPADKLPHVSSSSDKIDDDVWSDLDRDLTRAKELIRLATERMADDDVRSHEQESNGTTSTTNVATEQPVEHGRDDRPTEAARPPIQTPQDYYAAIAFSPTTGKCAYYNRQASWAAAEQGALKACNAPDARVVVSVRNGWCALALGDDWDADGGSYGCGAANTPDKASNLALKGCRDYTTGCFIALCFSADQLSVEPTPTVAAKQQRVKQPKPSDSDMETRSDKLTRCKTCRGGGKCIVCSGSGNSGLSCFGCNGSGRSANGNILFSGPTSCDRCNGSGRNRDSTCSQCGGSGKDCTGYSTQRAGEYSTCSLCAGNGKDKCSSCVGRGYCLSCRGTGYSVSR